MSSDRQQNFFYEPFLKFGVAKPEGWRFQPPAWSPTARLKNSADPEEDWAAYANLPFVCFMSSHESPTEAYPTVQIMARPSAVPTDAQVRSLLESLVQFMSAQFCEFEVEYASADHVLAGCRASLIRSRYTLFGDGEEEVEFGILARSYVIFSPGVAFTVGMSSSDDPDYYREAEFREVLESISIGRALRPPPRRSAPASVGLLAVSRTGK